MAVCLYLSRDQAKALIASSTAPAERSASSPCEGKKLCGVVYVAPWCPACNNLLPKLAVPLANAKDNKDFGMMIVVGQGKREGDNETKVSEIGAGAITDNDGFYHQKLRVEAYPSFYVINQNNRVVMQDQDAFIWHHTTLGVNP